MMLIQAVRKYSIAELDLSVTELLRITEKLVLDVYALTSF